MPKRNVVWILAIVGVALVTFWVTQQYRSPVRTPAPGEFNSVARVYRTINQSYYLDPNAHEIRRAAVEGMVSALDPYSTYVPPQRQTRFDHRIHGLQAGLGLVLEIVDRQVRVIGPVLNSPAHRAGIVGGDVLLRIDGESLEGLPLGDVETMLAGPLESAIELEIQRGQGWRKIFRVTREEFPLESVAGLYRQSDGHWTHLLQTDPRIAYVRVKEFVPETDRQLRDLLRRLGPLRGLVLDLRGNPGGILPPGVEAANVFLREGVIVTSVSRASPPRRYRARPEGTVAGPEVVVLIDDSTASAAEIVAGALRLHDRAVIVGTRSRGKGCVQSTIALPDDLGQINLTTAELMIGEDQPLNRIPGREAWGVLPHPGQEIALDPEAQRQLSRLRLRAEVLPPPRAQNEPATRPASTGPHADAVYQRFMAVDKPLARAMDLLREQGAIEEILTEAAAEREAARQAEASDGQEQES
jgi:carboxyl-terminal processing protease